MFAGSDTAVQLIQGSLNVAAYAGTQGLIPGVNMLPIYYDLRGSLSLATYCRNGYQGLIPRSSQICMQADNRDHQRESYMF